MANATMPRAPVAMARSAGGARQRGEARPGFPMPCKRRANVQTVMTKTMAGRLARAKAGGLAVERRARVSQAVSGRKAAHMRPHPHQRVRNRLALS